MRVGLFEPFLAYAAKQFDRFAPVLIVDLWLVGAIVLIQSVTYYRMQCGVFSHYSITKSFMMNFQKLSDRQLFVVCKKWGASVLAARRKFGGLLPEVFRREMVARVKGGSWVKKRGFTCVYEFAAKLAGMSRPQVDDVLRTERRLADKPILREALLRGEVSVNKLARVVSIATVDNQREILGKVEALSNRALEVFVKDYKIANGTEKVDGYGTLQSGLFADGLHMPQNERISDGSLKPQNGQMSLHVQNENAGIGLTGAIIKTGSDQGDQAQPRMGSVRDAQVQIGRISRKLPVNLDEDIAQELLEMESKNIDVNGLLREFLRERKEKYEREKAEVAEQQMRGRDDRAIIGYPAKRHVPVRVLRVIRAEFGDRCSAPGCVRAAENLHHEKGFVNEQCHDPRYLKPLCRGHHELVHAGAG